MQPGNNEELLEKIESFSKKFSQLKICTRTCDILNLNLLLKNEFLTSQEEKCLSKTIKKN